MIQQPRRCYEQSVYRTDQSTSYHLCPGQPGDHSEAQLTALIKDAVKHSPPRSTPRAPAPSSCLASSTTSCGTSSSRAQKDSPPEAYPQSEAKVNGSFRSGFGTVLFFEDTAVIEDLQQKFALGRRQLPHLVEHGTGIAQFAVWTTLAQEGHRASLQHYNPLMDQAVRQEWNLPASWLLRAQMPFGCIGTAGR